MFKSSNIKLVQVEESLVFIVVIILLSVIAGIFNRNTKSKSESFRIVSMDFFCSVVTGFIAYFILLGVTGNNLLSLGGAAYCGHLGPVGMDFITNRINKYLKGDGD